MTRSSKGGNREQNDARRMGAAKAPARKDGVFPGQARRDSESTNVGVIAANNFQGQPTLQLVEGHDGVLLGIIITA
jgi:hypothetical protein